MDKGLDIDEWRSLLAYHATLDGDLWRVLPPPPPAFESGDPAWYRQLLERLRESAWLPRERAAESALRWVEQPARALILLGDPRYPALLAAIDKPPLVLFVAGAVDTLHAPQMAIVGSRTATPCGTELAARLASELAACGVVTTSGLALGIDAAAHRGALRRGRTIAVLGCGVDRCYPPGHRELALAISQCGALVSEFPLGTAPHARHFPRRNRIISGLALGTVVVEAALRSGSLSTARHALEQGREVFAVPGAVGNPQARGCHLLLRHGAKLTEGVGDILQEFPYLSVARRSAAESGAGREELPREADPVLRACGWDPFTIEDIVTRSGLTVQEVSSMLLTLELLGVVHAQATGTYVRVA
jgi:DNA processing protein